MKKKKQIFGKNIEYNIYIYIYSEFKQEFFQKINNTLSVRENKKKTPLILYRKDNIKTATQSTSKNKDKLRTENGSPNLRYNNKLQKPLLTSTSKQKPKENNFKNAVLRVNNYNCNTNREKLNYTLNNNNINNYNINNNCISENSLKKIKKEKYKKINVNPTKTKYNRNNNVPIPKQNIQNKCNNKSKRAIKNIDTETDFINNNIKVNKTAILNYNNIPYSNSTTNKK